MTYTRLGSMAPLAMLSQQDYWVDIILREMERELSESLQKESPAGIGSFELANQLQLVLTRMWLLSIYELIRVANSSKTGAENSAIRVLYERLTLVRIPMAKGEIAQERHLPDGLQLVAGEGETERIHKYEKKKTNNYIVPMFVRSESGSIGWYVAQSKPLATVELTRRELSDELLAAFGA
jgi:hypothetical protein